MAEKKNVTDKILTKIIHDEELPAALNDGWEVVATIPRFMLYPLYRMSRPNPDYLDPETNDLREQWEIDRDDYKAGTLVVTDTSGRAFWTARNMWHARAIKDARRAEKKSK